MAGFNAPSSSFILLSLIILLVFYVRPSYAFGAGNIASISRVEGQNWRHGDIEDTLLSLLMSRAANKKFSKLDVKRVYFGNWLRDYSQAVDVGTVKYVSAEAIRLLLWILGFMSFGFGTREFEVTHDRLGVYRPEEHIDNPKDYADNLDARQYDRRLRGPVDERRELSIDERTGMKAYIAAEDRGITTSAALVRNLYGRSIDLARRARRSGNDDDLYEAFRLLGTANHCLEDFSAHSNYVELCLIEMGERDVFPHVGRRTQVQVRGARGPIWPLITGTFGGVDFLHSVMGEFSDKATQSEIDELEGTISNAERNRQSASIIKDLLSNLPSGIFSGDESSKVDELQANATAAQMQNMQISPKDPEEFTRQAAELAQQIYPVLEFHDNLMRSINEVIESIPVLPDLIEQLQDQLSIFVFSLIAPFVLPIIQQIKTELNTGSSEIIQSSKDKQLIVFRDDSSTDPTHSMISKDHFSNVLNEPAGKVASQVLKWVVPQIVECWDDERIDVSRTINRIINGVFHHPALREYGDDGARDGRQLMFSIVDQWWREQSDRGRSELRDKLSRDGVEQGRNHIEGVHDSGHGCGKPLSMAKSNPSSGYGGGMPQQISSGVGNVVGEAVGGGALGSIVGGLVGGVGASLLGGAFEQFGDTNSSKTEGYGRDGSYTQTYTETGQRPSESYGGGQVYGQAQYTRTEYPGGGSREEYSRREEKNTTYGGGYEQHNVEQRYESGGQYHSETHSKNRHHGHKSDEDDSDDYEKKERKRREKERRRQQGYEGEDSDDSEKDKYREHRHHRRDNSEEQERYQQRSTEYGQEYSGGRSEEYGSGRAQYAQEGFGGPERSEYGRAEETYEGRPEGGFNEYGGRRQDEYGGSEGYGRSQGRYGRREDEEDEYGGSRRQYGGNEDSYGGYGGEY